jgi:two-component system sensor histidine kinase/response regulator
MNNLIVDFSKFTILIVDDNAKNLQVIGNVLMEVGYKIIVAMNAIKAIEIINKKAPDLMLLDVMMPEVDGFQMANIIRENKVFDDIPIIFLTAKNDVKDIIDGFKNGAVDYITKPFNHDELLMRVKSHLELKYSKDIIKQKNEHLEELLKEKNEILSIAAHDLKNPLAGIIGFNEIIKNYYKRLTEEEIQNYSSLIDTSSRRMLAIISDLLDVNSVEIGKMTFNSTNFNLDEILEELVFSYRKRAQEKNIEIVYKVNDGTIPVFCDMTRTTQIFDNLISNALKFSDFNKKIYINSGVMEFENVKYSFAEIKDEGPGFTEEDKKKVFGKFARLSATPTNNEHSTGLGLSIVKKITESMNGRIILESQEGLGSSFFVYLPIGNLEEQYLD